MAVMHAMVVRPCEIFWRKLLTSVLTNTLVILDLYVKYIPVDVIFLLSLDDMGGAISQPFNGLTDGFLLWMLHHFVFEPFDKRARVFVTDPLFTFGRILLS